ncbi:hypothetical protein [Anaerosolibacter sp.]|nr:hypothetical protein [Anaerosolibacter sp.]
MKKDWDFIRHMKKCSKLQKKGDKYFCSFTKGKCSKEVCHFYIGSN